MKGVRNSEFGIRNPRLPRVRREVGGKSEIRNPKFEIELGYGL
jgi:hypothetical protein